MKVIFILQNVLLTVQLAFGGPNFPYNWEKKNQFKWKKKGLSLAFLNRIESPFLFQLVFLN